MEMLKSTGYTRMMENYRIVIPEQVAKDLGFAPGDYIFINPDHAKLILIKSQARLKYDDLYSQLDDLYSFKVSPSFCNRWVVNDGDKYDVLYNKEYSEIHLHFQDPGNSKLKRSIIDLLEEDLEESLSKLYDFLDIRSGDIAPEQQLRLDEIISELADLYVVLVEQNRG